MPTESCCTCTGVPTGGCCLTACRELLYCYLYWSAHRELLHLYWSAHWGLLLDCLSRAVILLLVLECPPRAVLECPLGVVACLPVECCCYLYWSAHRELLHLYWSAHWGLLHLYLTACMLNAVALLLVLECPLRAITLALAVVPVLECPPEA